MMDSKDDLTVEKYYSVVVTRLVDEDQLEEEDLSVPEYWDTSLPEGSEDWNESQRAKYVLDDFHQSVAIAMLDDFSISVFDPDGNEIFEDFEDQEPEGLVSTEKKMSL